MKMASARSAALSSALAARESIAFATVLSLLAPVCWQRAQSYLIVVANDDHVPDRRAMQVFKHENYRRDPKPVGGNGKAFKTSHSMRNVAMKQSTSTKARQQWVSGKLAAAAVAKAAARYASPSMLLRYFFCANSLLLSQGCVLETGSSEVADIDNQDANAVGVNDTELGFLARLARSGHTI